MNHTTLNNFLNNAEDIINNIIDTDETIAIRAEEDSVVLMSRNRYNYLVGLIRDKNKIEE